MDTRFACALLFACTTLATGSAMAMTKCIGKDGKVIYTDGECEAGQKAAGVTIHHSSGMDGGPKASPSNVSSSSAGPKSLNLPPPPKLDHSPIPRPIHLDDPSVNPGVRQHAGWQYEQAQKARAAANKQKMDDWQKEVDRIQGK